MLIVKLKTNKEQPLQKGHPWVFSGAIDDVRGENDNSGLCRVIDNKGRFVCVGFYNPYSQIAVRVLTTTKEKTDRAFFRRRIESAIGLRRAFIPADTTCYRLINGEGDYLPGLSVDVYDKVLILQSHCPAVDNLKQDLAAILHDLYPEHIIHERSDMWTRKAEGLPLTQGTLFGNPDSGDVQCREDGKFFAVDVFNGDRSGFYLHNSTARKRLEAYARDRVVLDLFSYSGGFSVCALAGGARSVVSVDNSAPAQTMLRKNMDRNHVKPFAWQHEKTDVSAFLNQNREKFDLIICDPPALQSIPADYTKINLQALNHLKPGGILFSMGSLQPQLGEKNFYKAISRAVNDAGRQARIIEVLSQPPHFPELPTHPEGRILQGLVLYVD